MHLRAIANSIARRLRRTRPARGQGLAEYALVLAMIAMVAVIAVGFLGGQISSALAVELLPGRGTTPVITPDPIKPVPAPTVILVP
jgi:Flp pilus assembly pilin Flp